MSVTTWWRDAIAKIIFLYVVFQFLQQLYYIYNAFTTLRNPIIPTSLSDYIAFPHYFLIFFWALAVMLFYTFINNVKLQQQRFWVIPISLVAFLLGNFFLYLLLMKLNPFG